MRRIVHIFGLAVLVIGALGLVFIAGVYVYGLVS